MTEGDDWMVRRWLSAAVAIVAWTSVCVADPASPDGGTIEPKVTGIGAKISIAGERYITIHRQSRNQNIGPVIHYFHKPLFILKTNPQPIQGNPSIVLSPPQQEGDNTFITFGFILTTPQFQEDARGFVIANDPELKQPGSQVSLNDIRVDGWPIIKLDIKLVRSLGNTTTVLGEWVSPSLEAAGETVMFSIGMTPASLELFRRYAGSGDLQFVPSYTFRNVRQQFAASLSTASREINQALQQTINSVNLAPGSPIFQTQANEFRDQLSTKLVTQISASSAALVPLVQSQLADHYLTSQTVSIDSIQDKALLDAIYGYLKPLFQKAANKRTQENTTTSSQEEGTTIKLGGKVDIGVVGANFGVDQSDKDDIARKSGTTFEWSQTDQAYEPHNIKIYKLSNVTDQDTVQVVSQAFISQGGDPSFQDDTPIPSDFTDARVGSFHSGDMSENFDGVLPGMAFCYFGNQIPHGYVELDGITKWPEAAWVPEGLKGKVMPAGQNLLVGITQRSNEVGHVWNSGHIPPTPAQLPLTSNWLSLTQGTDNGQLLIVSGVSTNSGQAVKSGDQIATPDSVILSLGAARTVTGISGSTKLTLSPLQLNDISTTPQHVRCRLIVKQ